MTNDNEPTLRALIGAALAASQRAGPPSSAMQGALMAWAAMPDNLDAQAIANQAIADRVDAMEAEAEALRALTNRMARRAL